MWLLEFLFGVFLAYLIMSPRLRNFILRHNHTPNIEKRIDIEEKREHATPISKPHHNFYKPEVEVEDNELERWYERNPELRELNGK